MSCSARHRPDQTRFIEDLIAGRLTVTDPHQALEGADLTQARRRDWILTHWPHVVEHHELQRLAVNTLPDDVSAALERLAATPLPPAEREERSLAQLHLALEQLEPGRHVADVMRQLVEVSDRRQAVERQLEMVRKVRLYAVPSGRRRRTSYTEPRAVDPAGATMCFADWAQHWLDTDTAKTATARATDQSLLRSAILPAIGHRQLGSITPTEVQRLVASWNTTRKPRSVRRTYSVLAAAFNAAVAADMVARSPCRGVKLPVVEPATARVLSALDLRRLKEELPIQYRAMVTLGANLGLRFVRPPGCASDVLTSDRASSTSGKRSAKPTACSSRNHPRPAPLADPSR